MVIFDIIFCVAGVLLAALITTSHFLGKYAGPVHCDGSKWSRLKAAFVEPSHSVVGCFPWLMAVWIWVLGVMRFTAISNAAFTFGITLGLYEDIVCPGLSFACFAVMAFSIVIFTSFVKPRAIQEASKISATVESVDTYDDSWNGLHVVFRTTDGTSLSHNFDSRYQNIIRVGDEIVFCYIPSVHNEPQIQFVELNGSKFPKF